jgi:hypothetical protein
MPFAVDDQPRNLVIADFDGDGVPDIAAANFLSASVSVLHGTGGGSFGENVEYGASGRPLSLAKGDLDGDGLVDLVASLYDTSMVTLLHNGGCALLGVPSGAGQRPFASLRTYPNPARSDVRIQFTLAASGRIEAEVFDVAGRRVATPARGVALAPGLHEVRWNFETDAGRQVPEGLYRVRIRTGSEVLVGSVLRIR